MVGALIWALNQKPKMSESNYVVSTNKTLPGQIIVPSGKLEAFYSKVHGKNFSVIKMDGTIDERQDDLQELAKDWIFYRDRIMKYSSEANYEKVQKARMNFQKINVWLEAYDSNDVSFMISVSK